jgi:hypothetical protein
MQGTRTGNKPGEESSAETVEKWRKNTVLKTNGKKVVSNLFILEAWYRKKVGSKMR